MMILFNLLIRNDEKEGSVIDRNSMAVHKSHRKKLKIWKRPNNINSKQLCAVIAHYVR
jgi:hypothetical protein